MSGGYSSAGRSFLGRCAHHGAGLLLVTLGGTGCGNALYAVSAGSAEARLEEARESGAEVRAAYHFVMAEEYLKAARREAAEADYSDAIDFATLSEEHATLALEALASKHSQGATSPPSSSGEDSE